MPPLLQPNPLSNSNDSRSWLLTGTLPINLWQQCKQDLHYSILPSQAQSQSVGGTTWNPCWALGSIPGAQGSGVSLYRLPCNSSSFLLSLSPTCTSGSHFLLTQSLGPISVQLPLSWSRPRPTSYSSPLSQLRHTSVCTLPPTRKVANTRRMSGAAKRKLKATPLEVRDMVEGTEELTSLDHPPPGASTGQGLATRHGCLLGSPGQRRTQHLWQLLLASAHTGTQQHTHAIPDK